MNINSLKVFWRNFMKQKTVGILSIGSLAVAIAVVILIGLWAANEYSFDKFQKDGDKIYRVYGSLMLNNTPTSVGSTYKILGADAAAKFPEIMEMCRITPQQLEIKIDDILYPGNDIFLVDSNFFTFFTFALRTGDPRTCLSAPDGVVIDEYSANRYFPGENPIGKTIKIKDENYNEDKIYTVTAVMKNMPENSHLKAHIVCPFLGYWAKDEYLGYGSSDCFLTYFKIGNPAFVPGLEEGMTELIRQSHSQWDQLGFSYKLQPLSDIHFNNSFKFDNIVHGNKSLVMVFLLTAFVILLIACINFINLFISTSFLRAKSIGVKKTHGADKGMLIREFYKETFYYVLVALGIGVILARLGLPLFNRLADYHLSIDFTNPWLYVFLIGVALFVMLTAATFPALYMTKFNAVATLKGQFKGRNLSFLQKSLVVLQFTASIVILISVFFINKQVNYMIHKDLGFDKENVLYVYDRGGFMKNYEAFRNEMKNSPAIREVTLKDIDPAGWCRGNSVKKPGDDQEYLMEFYQIKPNYFDMMGMKMAAGQEFKEETGDSLHYCIINETAARMLGFTEPVGEKLYTDDQYFIVRGVVKDAQTKSLHQGVDPQIYFTFQSRIGTPTVLFKIQGDPQEAIRLIQNEWNDLNPGTPFDYYFLDNRYARLYKAETNAGQILGVAMVITLIISVAGLFAIAYYTTQRRLKEVGVRKVNGASVWELLFILNCDFFVWVGISFLIACPLAYIFVSSWLEGFVERTSLSWWIFAVVGVITFLVTLLTVSFQTWKAANVNPVKVLKSE